MTIDRPTFAASATDALADEYRLTDTQRDAVYQTLDVLVLDELTNEGAFSPTDALTIVRTLLDVRPPNTGSINQVTGSVTGAVIQVGDVNGGLRF